MLSKAEIQEVERVRDRIAKHLFEEEAQAWSYNKSWHNISDNDRKSYRRKADRILHLIRYIPSKDQSLPDRPYMSDLEYEQQTVDDFLWGATIAQEEMRGIANFKRCINIEEYKEGE